LEERIVMGSQVQRDKLMARPLATPV